MVLLHSQGWGMLGACGLLGKGRQRKATIGKGRVDLDVALLPSRVDVNCLERALGSGLL